MIKYHLAGRSSQLPVSECNSSWDGFHFRPENQDIFDRSSELSSRTTEFNAGRNSHPPAGRLNTICLREILNIRSENAILCGKVSISGRRNNFGPIWTHKFWSEDVCSCDSSNFGPENRDLPSSSSKLSSRRTEFNVGRNYHLLARRFHTTWLGEILNFLLENTIFLGNLSTFRAEN